MSKDIAKRAAAARALEYVKDGMTLGLGTGSTAEAFLTLLGGRKVRGVATSERTAAIARMLGIPIITLDEAGSLDLAVDGADEVDDGFRLIKGGGGALLREKLVAASAASVIIIVDEEKQVSTLGRFPLAIEIVAFAPEHVRTRIAALMTKFGDGKGEARLRRDQFGEPFLTDGNNLIVDAQFGRIADPDGLAAALKSVTGVVDHGLFIGLCHRLIVGKADGTASLLDRAA